MSQISASTESFQWRKALRSIGNGNCVEVSSARTGIVVRDSKAPDGPILAYPAESWRTFAHEVRIGRFGISN
jgi:hypothetical protein